MKFKVNTVISPCMRKSELKYLKFCHVNLAIALKGKLEVSSEWIQVIFLEESAPPQPKK